MVENPEYKLDVTFAVLDDKIMSVGEKVLEN